MSQLMSLKQVLSSKCITVHTECIYPAQQAVSVSPGGEFRETGNNSEERTQQSTTNQLLSWLSKKAHLLLLDFLFGSR